MARGENIFKRKDGRWEARYIKGRDSSGKIRYGYCYGKTYKEAKEKVTLARVNQSMGKPAPGREPKRQFAFYCDEWLRTNRMTLKDATYVKYTTILERHIKPGLGACTPEDLTSAQVADFTDTLLNREGLSPKTVKDILVVLQSVWKHTTKQYAEPLRPVEILYPKAERKEMRVLSVAEQRRLTEYLLTDMDSCRFGVLLALQTGMRIGEICALRWSDVSLADRTVRVWGTMQRLQNAGPDDGGPKTKVMIGTPKSSTSQRVIPLPPNMALLCEAMYPHDSAAWLLTGTRQYMEPRTLQYRMQRYTAACGLDGVHFHTLRHTFATRCVEVGFDVKTLSEILGHATTTITLDRYVHASLDLKRQNMNKLSAVGW